MSASKKVALLLVVVSLLGALAAACGPQAPASGTTPPSGKPTGQAQTPAPQPTAPQGGIEVALNAIEWPKVDVVARVNSTEIKTQVWRDEVTRQLRMLTDQYQVDWNDKANTDRLPSVLERVLDYMIDVELLRQAAVQEKINISDAEVQAKVDETKQQIASTGQYPDFDTFLQKTGMTAESFQAVMRDQVIIDRLLVAHGGPTEAEQVHARHILVADEQKAKEVLAKLQAGESFEALAKANSTDAGSKDNGGDLGWFPRGAMVPEFDEAAFKLNPGETSGIVKSQFGYHIIRVEEKGVRKLDEPMASEMQQRNFMDWLEKQRDNAKIEKAYTAPPTPTPVVAPSTLPPVTPKS